MRRLPPLLLVRMKADLDQYLVDRGADGVRVFNWYHRQFTEAASARYCSDSQTTISLHKNLADYFSGIWANGNKKPYLSKSGASVAADRLVAPQPLTFGAAYNLRRLNNLPHHLLTAGDTSELKAVLGDFEFLLAKVSANNLRSVLDDFSAARYLMPNDLELRMITEALWLSQDALGYDPKLLAPQLIGRLKPTEGLRPFLEQCRQSSAPFLLPSQSILIQPGGQLIHSIPGHKKEVDHVCLTRDGAHAITTCDSDETAKIWNVSGGYLERSLEFDDGPEEVILACDDSVILICFDENIMAYTFDTGDLLYTICHDENALKFTVCGDSQKFVVLEATRVWIYNALDASLIKTIENDPTIGKKSSTTEEQVNDEPMAESSEQNPDANKQDKPAPEDLLVQNEPNNESGVARKHVEYGRSAKIAGGVRYVAATDDDNMYLQVIDVEEGVILAQKHFFENTKDADDEDDSDFTIETVIVTPDDSHVIVANYMDNNLHICDPVTLDVIKVLPGNGDDFTENFHITPSGRYLYFANTENLACWDLLEETRTYYIKESLDLTDSATNDMKTVITVGSDGNIRIWDLTREPTKSKPVIKAIKQTSNPEDEGDATSEADGDEDDDDAETENETEVKVKNVMHMGNDRYVSYIVREVKDGHRTFKLAIYDLVKSREVRRADTNEQLTSMKMINDTTGVVVTSTWKLKVIDLPTMTVTTVFKGMLSINNNDDFCLLKNKTELVCKSRGRKNLKVYNVSTGEVIHIIKPGLDKTTKLDDMVANDAVFAASTTDENNPCVLVYDASDYKLLKTFDCKTLGTEYLNLTGSHFSNDGSHLLLSISRTPAYKGTDDPYDKSLTYVVSVDLSRDDTMHHLVDEEDYEASILSDDYDLDIYSNSFAVLDSDHVIMGCEDAKIRIFNFRTGVLKTKLTGHISSVEIHTEPNADHFLTSGTGDEEQAFRLWDAKTYECVASYKLDFQKSQVHLSNKGHLIVGSTETDILTWTLCGANIDKHAIGGDVPVLFPGEKLDLILRVTAPDDTVEDPDDRDSDPAESESDLDSSDSSESDSDSDDTEEGSDDSPTKPVDNINLENMDLTFDEDDYDYDSLVTSQEFTAAMRPISHF